MIDWARAHWRRELLYAALSALESCWLYPWLLFLLGGGVGRRQVPLVALFCMLVAALYLTRFMEHRDVPLLTQRVSTIVVALLSSLLLVRLYPYGEYRAADLSWLLRFVREIANVMQHVPYSLVAFVVGLYLWWRGISLAQRELDVGSAGLSFRVGIIAFFWLSLFAVFGPRVDSVVPAFGFFFLGLIAVGLARIEEVSHGHVGIRTPFNASWMGILTGSTLVVSGLSLLATNLLSVRTVSALLRWLRPVAALLGKVTEPLWAVLALLLELVLGFLIDVFKRLFAARGVPNEALEQLAEQLREWQQAAPVKASLPLVFQLLKWGFLSFFFLAILTLLALSIDRRWRAMQEGRTAEHESVWRAEGGTRDVRDALDSRWRRLREDLQARLAHLRGEQYSLVTIRHIYASLIKLATATGFARREAETPYEYTATLRRAFPDSEQEVMLITDGYVHTHYGERAFAPEYVQRLREAWTTIRMRQERGSGG